MRITAPLLDCWRAGRGGWASSYENIMWSELYNNFVEELEQPRAMSII